MHLANEAIPEPGMLDLSTSRSRGWFSAVGALKWEAGGGGRGSRTKGRQQQRQQQQQQQQRSRQQQEEDGGSSNPSSWQPT